MVRQELDRSWADLPFEIISLIASKRSKDAAVYLSVGLVCRQWHRHLTDYSPVEILPPQLPFLLVPPHAIPNSSLGRVFPLPVLDSSDVPISVDDMPQLANTRHCISVGSSHGWLVVLGQDSSISLLNPVTADSIPLQPLSSIDRQFLSFDTNSSLEYNLTNKGISHSQFSVVQCAVLSSDPAEDRQFTLLLFITDLKDCCFTLKGRGGVWSSHVHKPRGVKDVVFINGVFITIGKKTCNLSVFDFRNSEAGLVVRQVRLLWNLDGHDIFLVILNGHLSMVFTKPLIDPKPDHMPRGFLRKILYFDNFELDNFNVTIRRIHELSGIALFLGHGCSGTVSVQHFPWLMEGSVYFTAVSIKLERVEGQGDRLIAFSQGSVYQLTLSAEESMQKRESIKVFDVDQSRYADLWNSPRPFWVTPNIKRIQNSL